MQNIELYQNYFKGYPELPSCSFQKQDQGPESWGVTWRQAGCPTKYTHTFTADGSIVNTECVLINVAFIIIQSVGIHFWGYLIFNREQKIVAHDVLEYSEGLCFPKL